MWCEGTYSIWELIRIGALINKNKFEGAFTKEGTFILTKAVNLIFTVTIKSERKRNSARNLLHEPRARIVRGI